MCLAQGLQCSDAGEAQTHGPLAPRSQVKHSTTEPLRSRQKDLNVALVLQSYYKLLSYVLYCIHFLRTSACVCRTSENCKSAFPTKRFKCCTCPAGRLTYNFHSSCKHMHQSLKSVCNKEHKGVICNITE